MKKLLLAVPLVAGASWAGASYYTGAQTQSAYDQLLVQFNELKPFTLVNDDYVSGLTNSTAITKVMASTAADAEVLFRLRHDIQHSPIGFNDGGGVRVGAATIKTTVVRDDSLPEELKEFMASFEDEEAILINTSIGFDGNSVHQLLISKYQNKFDEANVRFDGVDYTASVVGDKVTGAGTIGELFVTGNEGEEVRLSPGNITTDLNRISHAVYSGSYGIEFDELTVKGDELPSDMSFSTIAMVSDTDLTDGKLNSRGGFSVGNINSPLPVTSASLDVNVNGLPLASIEKYIEAVSGLSIFDQMTASDSENVELLVDALKGFVAPGASIGYDINVGTQMGDAEAHYGLSVVDANSPNFPVNGLDSVETARDLLNMLKAEMHVKADAAVVDQTPLAMFMMSPQAQQMIISDGVTYSSDIVVSDLIVNINGNPMSLEIMIGEMLDMPLKDLMSM